MFKEALNILGGAARGISMCGRGTAAKKIIQVTEIVNAIKLLEAAEKVDKWVCQRAVSVLTDPFIYHPEAHKQLSALLEALPDRDTPSASEDTPD